MTKHELVALMTNPGPKDCPTGLKAWNVEGAAAIVKTGGSSVIPRLNRRSVLKGLVRRQRQLEELMSQGTVIPTLPGIRLDKPAMSRLVMANAAMIDDLLARFDGRVQFQITIEWDPSIGTTELGSSGRVDAKALRSEAVAKATALIWGIVEDLVDLPREPATLLNVAVLIDYSREPDLDRVLEEIDAAWSGRLMIKQVGPSPAVSFASLGVRHIGSAATKAARAALGAAAFQDEPDVMAARRRAIMAASPEDRTSLMDAANVVCASMRAQSDTFPLAFVWREGQAAVADGRKDVA